MTSASALTGTGLVAAATVLLSPPMTGSASTEGLSPPDVEAMLEFVLPP